HHLPLQALALIAADASRDEASIRFQIRADIVKAKLDENHIDPSGSDTLRYGILWVERYRDSPSKKLASRVFGASVGDDGLIPCCADSSFRPILGLPTETRRGDVLLSSSQVVVRYDPGLEEPALLDGEQVSCVVRVGQSQTS